MVTYQSSQWWYAVFDFNVVYMNFECLLDLATCINVQNDFESFNLRMCIWLNTNHGFSPHSL